MSLFRLSRLPRHRWFRIGIVLALILLTITWGSYRAVRLAGEGRTFGDLDGVPHRRAAVVMGCSPLVADGRTNLFFRYRIEAAATLFKAGKVDYLIVSGDNRRAEYDEPTAMRDALVASGVPEDRIYRDYAGFRTLDSVIRAREVFGQGDFIVVSQPFHAERAIYIAQAHGIEAIGFQARDVHRFGGLRAKARECLARVRTVLDVHCFGTKPKFLGPAVELGGPVT